MKPTLAFVLIPLVMVLAAACRQSVPASPKEFNNIDWLQSLPPTPGAHMILDIPESLELTGYTGFRFFARLPKIEVKPGQAIYYVKGTHVYEGPPNRLRLVRSTGLSIKDVTAVGGSVALSDLPDGLEYTVFCHRDESGGASGFERFGFVNPTHHQRVSGGWPFELKIPPNAGWGCSGISAEIELDKEVEIGQLVATPMTADGHQDDEHTTTVRWYFALKVAPRPFVQ